MKPAAVRSASLLACLLASVAGCGDAELKPCDDIPEGGCPLDRGGSCDDLACVAIWGCYDGAWSLEETCAHGGTAAAATASSSATTGGCTPFGIDRTGETTGCAPDLLEPDCPADALETCAPCALGCVDFFLCTSEGWTGVAHCTDEGHVVADR